ncbi:MAG TPA: hypothetical protein VKQ11_07900 [Candidatus Sulfotelmatobacter sp.]|nr:hypothetical protein [Candidatus Sulfotelmatobacter sp.]
MFRYIALGLLLSALAVGPISAQDDDKSGKPLDVQSSVGDLHVGKDADAQKAGLPLYPGAHPKHQPDNDPLNFGILTESFGLKLVVAKYESHDPAEKILAYYKDKMKKYGKVIECHNTNDSTGAHSDSNDDRDRPLKCEGDNTGPVRELKVGTEHNARIVSIESSEAGRGTTFAIVYLRSHGKTGEI